MNDFPDGALERLQDRLGYRFRDAALLREAMVHTSYLNEAGDPRLRSNERLEFLGDAVLGAVVGQQLFTDFPEASEGWMTRARSQLVRNDTLAEIGDELRLGGIILTGVGGVSKPHQALAQAVEAVLGAVLLDGGYDAARSTVMHLLRLQFEQLDDDETFEDAKSELQRYTQSRDGSVPRYRILEERGPPHSPTFRAAVCTEDGVSAEGEGSSKQAAEQDAARRALAMLQAEVTP